jgi:hypothetical protein
VSALSGISRKRALGIRFIAATEYVKLRGLMKSSAELIHVSGTLIRSIFAHGL